MYYVIVSLVPNEISRVIAYYYVVHCAVRTVNKTANSALVVYTSCILHFA